MLLSRRGWASRVVGATEGLRYRTPTHEEVMCIRERLETWSEWEYHQRAEDRIREELRDARSAALPTKAKVNPLGRRVARNQMRHA